MKGKLRVRELLRCWVVTWLGPALFLSLSVSAQEIIQSYSGFWDDANFYPDVAVLNDFGGDRYGELVVGDAAWGTDKGKVTVLSGLTGNPIYELPGPSAALLGMQVANLGDVDGDGVTDFGGTGDDYSNGLFRIWSGQDGSIVCEQTSASRGIARIGDLDGDMRDDFVVGKPGVRAMVFLASGCPTPHLIVGAPPFIEFFGWAAAGLGDVTGDKTPDFAVSDPGDLGNINCLPGYVGVFSGRDGSLVWERYGETAHDLLGWSLAAPGDLNGDGIGDLVVGAPQADGVNDCQSGSLGRIYFFDGPTGTLINKVVTLDNYDTMGYEVANAGDANGNGVPDVLVSNHDSNLISGGYEILLVDGASGDTVYTIASTYGPVNYGHAMAGLGDGDGDDFPDFLAGGAGIGLGRLDLYSGAPIGVSAFGTACPAASGTMPRIGATGSPYIGTKYPLHLSQVAPDLTAFLVVGLSDTVWMGMSLPVDLGPVGMPGCQLLVGPAKIIATQTIHVTPGLGAATIKIPIPNQPALTGFSGYAQWFVTNPPGSPSPGAATRGLKITLQAPPS